MTFDLWLLLAATALGLVHVSAASFLSRAAADSGDGGGRSQDQSQDLAGRLRRMVNRLKSMTAAEMEALADYISRFDQPPLPSRDVEVRELPPSPG